jgi:hypothetical protein
VKQRFKFLCDSSPQACLGCRIFILHTCYSWNLAPRQLEVALELPFGVVSGGKFAGLNFSDRLFTSPPPLGDFHSPATTYACAASLVDATRCRPVGTRPLPLPPTTVCPTSAVSARTPLPLLGQSPATAPAPMPSPLPVWPPAAILA